jgi:hypothetical protein
MLLVQASQERALAVPEFDMSAVTSSNKSKELPLFAQLAFAARCARRVVNLFRLQINHPDLATCCKSLGTAVRLTELFAGGNDVDAAELATAEAGILRAVAAATEMQPPNDRSAAAAKSAHAALCAVKAALDARGSQSPAEGAVGVAMAAKIARDSASAADENLARSARNDWEKLHQMSLGHFPDFGEPIDPGENGRLGSLFQDFSRGAPSTTTRGGAADKNKLNPAATGWARSGRPLELGAAPPTNAWAEQIEQRAAELGARQEELDDHELQLAQRQAALDEEVRKQQQELTSSRLELEAERNATRAAFDSLEEERREFLEQRLQWNPASSQS